MQDLGAEGGIILWHVRVVLEDLNIIFRCVSTCYYVTLTIDIPITSMGSVTVLQCLLLDVMLGDATWYAV
jgi:hypothetical protein